MVFLYTTTYRGPGPYFFFILRELRDKKTKKDGLLFPGVFLFIRDDWFFLSVAYFYINSSFSSPFFVFDWRRTVVKPGTKGGVFYGSRPIVLKRLSGLGRDLWCPQNRRPFYIATHNGSTPIHQDNLSL